MASRTNPDTRPLPAGWIELLDEQRNLWYYKNVSVNPNRISYVHPLGPDPTYASVQSGTRTSGSGNMSKAQLLYASSMSNMNRNPVQLEIHPATSSSSPSDGFRGETAAPTQPHQQQVSSDYSAMNQNLSLRPGREAYICPPPDSEYQTPAHQQHSRGTNSDVIDYLSAATSLRRELPSTYSEVCDPEPEQGAPPPGWTATNEIEEDDGDSQLAYLAGDAHRVPQRQPTLPSYSEPSFPDDIPETNSALSRQEDLATRQVHVEVPSYSEEPPNIPQPSENAPSAHPSQATGGTAQQQSSFNSRRPSGARPASERRVSGLHILPSPAASVHTFSSGSSSQSASPAPSFYSFSQSPQGPRNLSTVASPVTPASVAPSLPPPPPPNKPSSDPIAVGPQPHHPSRTAPATPTSARPPAGFHRPSEPNVAHPSLPAPQLPHRSYSAQARVGGFDARSNAQFPSAPPQGPSLPPLPQWSVPPALNYVTPATPVNVQNGPAPQQMQTAAPFQPHPNFAPNNQAAPAQAQAPAQHNRGIVDTLTHNKTIRNGVLGGIAGLVGAAVLNTVVNGDPTQSVLSSDTISSAINGVSNFVGGGDSGGDGGGGGIFDNSQNFTSTDQSSQPDYSNMFNGVDQQDPVSIAPSDYLLQPSSPVLDPSSFDTSNYSPPPSANGFDSSMNDPSMNNNLNYSPPPQNSYFDSSSYNAYSYSPPPVNSSLDSGAYNAYDNNTPPPSSPGGNNQFSVDTSNNQTSSSSGDGPLSKMHDMLDEVKKIYKHGQQQNSHAQTQVQAPIYQHQQHQAQAHTAVSQSQPQHQASAYQQPPQTHPNPPHPQYTQSSGFHNQTQGQLSGWQQQHPQQIYPNQLQLQQQQHAHPGRKQQLEAQLAQIQQEQAAMYKKLNDEITTQPDQSAYLVNFNRMKKEQDMRMDQVRAELVRLQQQEELAKVNQQIQFASKLEQDSYHNALLILEPDAYLKFDTQQHNQNGNSGNHPPPFRPFNQNNSDNFFQQMHPLNFAGQSSNLNSYQQTPPAHHSAHLGHSANHHTPHLGVYAAHQAHHARPNFSGPHPPHHPPHVQQLPQHSQATQQHHMISNKMSEKLGEYTVKGVVKLGGMLFGNN
ncbi:hypothetical protein SCHPADRAFT_902092 [Schizopora paradoxa]|uniref:WW domain-containing protein n=1 Tax=Schizopora paradoxa TaxID=27342 RepID=A0A0H2RV47_9AGAM|nr:hypothetical protein SCHPADRAFT_902092 [Schizopora paradoxa]